MEGCIEYDGGGNGDLHRDGSGNFFIVRRRRHRQGRTLLCARAIALPLPPPPPPSQRVIWDTRRFAMEDGMEEERGGILGKGINK